MDGIILAGGIGKRMRPLTDVTPKPMLIVQGKPILEWSLLTLKPVAERVVVVVSYLKEQIETFMKTQSIFPDYVIVKQLPEPLGTGHALTCCEPFLHSSEFIVVNGDDLYNRRAIAALSQTSFGVMTAQRDDPTRWAVVVTNTHGNVERLHEKPPEGLYTPPVQVNTGAYKFQRSIFAYSLPRSERGEYEITDYVTYAARHFDVHAIPVGFWATIGTPEDYEAAQKLDLKALLFDESG